MGYDSIFKPDLFAGQTIVVTGGGSGIGRCTAHELAALGARVLLVGRKADKLHKVAAEIAEDGGQASGHACDIRDEDAVKALVSELIRDHGPLHGLVNNAGGQYPRPWPRSTRRDLKPCCAPTWWAVFSWPGKSSTSP